MPALVTRADGSSFKERILPAPPDRAAGSSDIVPAAVQSRGRRELMILVILLACGLFLIPLLIWAVGRGVLGPYADGGPFALLVDFFTGLKSGSLVYWSVAFGPYVIVMILRLCWHFVRSADGATE
jgi:hypothetical protein